MQSVPFSTNGSAHLELRYPGEGLPQLPAVEKFSKRKQLVGIVQHLSVDGTGAVYCTPKVGHFWGVFYEI